MSPLRSDRQALVLLLALTFGTGIVDACCYLGLDRVFTGNMTGNVIILGMGLVGAEDLPVAGPLVALGGFFVGAVGAGRVIRGRRGWGSWTTTLLSVVTTLLAAVTLVLAFDDSPALTERLVITAVLSVAMGAQAAAARSIGFRELTTVAVTANIVGLASETWPGHESHTVNVARGLAVVAIVLGALAGALTLQWHLAVALALATLVVAAVTIAAWTATATARP